MPAESALTEARRKAGPSYRGGDPERFRIQLEGWIAFAAPAVLIIALAVAGGGYDVTPRHIAGLAVWVLVVVLLALGAASRATVARPLYWVSGLILSLAVLSALSALWSGSAEISATEADRVLVYLGVFVLAFLIAQNDHGRQRFGEGIWLGLLGIAVLMLATRLLPEVFPVDAGLGSGSRIRYPLGYWNANGVACGIGVALALWMSRRATVPLLRWAAVAGMPVMLLGLYLTYSRGGLLSLLVASICLVALSHDRLWLLCTLGIGALSTLPAVLYVQGNEAIAHNADWEGVIEQGVWTVCILLAGVALALALYWGLRRLERSGGELTGRALALSRDRRVLRGVAIGAAVIALIGAVVVGERAWDQFTETDISFPSDPQEQFGNLSGSGRGEFFRVALDSFAEQPLFGHGAGTYQFAWNQLRDIDVRVHDAHSVYLQALSELGIVGGALVIGLFGAVLWFGFAAWRDGGGPQRELYAALLAAALAFAIGAAIDWFWQIADLGFVFFLAGGVLVAARCRQLARRRALSNGQPQPPRRYGLAVAGLAVAWLTALALIGPLLVDREIEASKAAAARGEMANAVNHAETARSIEPWAATPYLQLGLLAQAEGDHATAIERLGQAIDREDENWILYYLRSKAEHEAGDLRAAEADLERAQQLNPLEECLTKGWDGCG